jgi:hypothetical protein
MEYRIIIVRNNKKKKLLFKGNDKEYAYKKYKNLLKTNRVLFPKKHNNYLKNKPVKFELLLVKEKEELLKNPAHYKIGFKNELFG